MISIRRARPADAPAIGEIHAAVWRSSYAGILPDAYLAAREASEAIDPHDDDALDASSDALYEREEALAQIVPTTRAGAERMVEIILKANHGFIGADTIEMAMRSLVAAIPA